MPLLDPNQAYTFSQIFALKLEVDELVTEFGYSLIRTPLHLAEYAGELDRLDETRRRIEEVLPYVNLNNEATRREVLISPIVTDLVHYTRAQLRIEYPIKVTLQLQGNFDYLLRTQIHLLVIEAKQEDLTNGFTQLTTELIALDLWSKAPDVTVQPELIGAVTTGTIWQFGVLHRQSKQISQGLNSYRVPEDLEQVVRILIEALLSRSQSLA
ncbi:MAG: hypothetical protein KME60_21025 [Cyanomargarita calcarea GSE-NOS-MK-12-04C]|jgi:hypothetical protein|uniref:Type I restriction enzyme R protein N-terminal domain-containing protein n=1 Tax=Cyanomargarita calcarea GSE-NOS-MK-12-04C TaxID=2839659 RepID=A0A951UTL2_9CYAN|nr:hypothetical protein [Cyanomargarita calcarea GSE-NOS-MK-12-04C]